MSEDKEAKARSFDWIDRRDFVCMLGLGMLGTGLWWLSPAAGLIIPGAILTYISIFGTKG